jgi:aminoglycoside/choline kinase family phosphotransferase
MDHREADIILQETRLRMGGWKDARLTIEPILKGGSDRWYYRITAHDVPCTPTSVIVMVYTMKRPDNLSFFPATKALARSGARTLCIYSHDEENMRAWLEDLGGEDLWNAKGDAARRKELYQCTLREAAKVHTLSWSEIPAEVRAGLQPPFDEQLYAWEQGYFFDQWAARFSAADAATLEAVRHGGELAALRRELAALPRSPVHRDFQSQNVIIRGGEAWLIDYQGLREGRPEYDLASLLYDPYVGLPADERTSLTDYYFQLRGLTCDTRVLAMCTCQRLMQALGAYGKLGAGDGKKAFLGHIRPAVRILRGVLEERGLLPSLLPVLEIRAGALEEAGHNEPTA